MSYTALLMSFCATAASTPATSSTQLRLRPIPAQSFGADAGGPIIKSKCFFGDYEGIRQLLSTTTVDIVPSAAARDGDLTSVLLVWIQV